MSLTNVQLAAQAKVIQPAQTTARVFGVPASVTLAQWEIESTYGVSQLARQANNFFGIKAVPGEAYMEFPTHEVVRGRTVAEMADFARYGTAVDCFVAHAYLLSSSPRYAPAMAVKNDVQAFCHQLQACGYSTSPTYGVDLFTLIRQHGLLQYDTPPQPPVAAEQKAA